MTLSVSGSPKLPCAFEHRPTMAYSQTGEQSVRETFRQRSLTSIDLVMMHSLILRMELIANFITGGIRACFLLFLLKAQNQLQLLAICCLVFCGWILAYEWQLERWSTID